jgi:hypothetical protein
MKKITLIFLFLLLISFPATSLALTATSSADYESTDSAINPEIIKENIKNRIQKTLVGYSPVDYSKLKGWVGIVDSINNNSISISVVNNKRLVSTDENTEVIIGTKAAKVKDLEIGSRIVAIGEIDNSDILTAQKIFTIKQLPALTTRKANLILVENIKKDQTVDARLINDPSPLTFKITKKTLLTQNVTSAQQVDLKALMNLKSIKALAVYTTDADQNNNLIHLHTILPTSAENELLPSQSTAP